MIATRMSVIILAPFKHSQPESDDQARGSVLPKVALRRDPALPPIFSPVTRGRRGHCAIVHPGQQCSETVPHGGGCDRGFFLPSLDG